MIEAYSGGILKLFVGEGQTAFVVLSLPMRYYFDRKGKSVLNHYKRFDIIWNF